VIEVSEYTDEKVQCDSCTMDLTEDTDGQYSCEECDSVFCTDCSVRFEHLDVCICKECIDAAYPREKEVVEKVVEKIVEVPNEPTKPMGFSEPIL
jgi:hypothetical protein